MPKSKYEQDRDANIQRIQDVFESLGIAVLNEAVSSLLSKEKVGKRKTLELEKPESDNDYDPNSDIDNHSDSGDDYDDDLNTEVRPMAPGARHPNKKQKAALVPASPARVTRATASKLRTPPRYTRATAPLITAIANLSTTNHVVASQNTTTMPTATNLQRTVSTSSSPTRSTRSNGQQFAINRTTQSTNIMPNPANSINTMPTPTSPRRLSRSSVVDNSPGQSSRQSNEINILSDHFDPANCSEAQTNEGEPHEDLVPVPPRNVCKKTMGHGLERMIKRGNKMPIQVTEGKLRPNVPVQAAKLASECGVALRDNLPIYTSWKQYQNREGQEEVEKVLRKVASRLDVDVRNDGPSKEACNDIIKKGVKQQRYLLKKQYFDESLTRE